MGRQSLILFAMKVLAILSVPTRILAITTTPMDPKLGYRKAAAWNLGAFGDFSIKLWGNFRPKNRKIVRRNRKPCCNLPWGFLGTLHRRKTIVGKTHIVQQSLDYLLFKLQSISQPFEFKELHLHCFLHTSDCPLGVSHALVGLWWSLLNQELISLDISYHAWHRRLWVG